MKTIELDKMILIKIPRVTLRLNRIYLLKVDGGVLKVYKLSEYVYVLIFFYYCQLILWLNVAIYGVIADSCIYLEINNNLRFLIFRQFHPASSA
jgi:hypothetical protein